VIAVSQMLEDITNYRDQLQEFLNRGEIEVYTYLRTLYEPMSDFKTARIESEISRLNVIISVLNKCDGT